MTHENEPTPPVPHQSMRWTEVLLHWTIFIGLMTALIGGAALLF
ncbi:hypothetical protein [Paracoccus tibetensis]|uniref:Uncharacterized protein n=1 Tax=Paracoccus tibetensis TaxID=336292 RepID=A0A1G5EX52_9RHOB|nr:hypothetical protein [Paracoccus tibetensis]SCY31537.1 hypothetical protein SAMN05660710_01271 [Paracoccus tibetensis]